MEANQITFELRHPFTASIVGPTMSGKTNITLELLERRLEIMGDFDKIIYVYAEYQKLFDIFKKKHPEVIFTNSMSELDKTDGTKKCQLIFDDKMLDFL